ncbi:MAG: permease [Candidatus Woesearchaeota archaeon]|nr:MAG: permease [Candidatus Woesearchaeota archaeon]
MSKVSERTVLITNIVKWVILSIIIGILGGLTTTAFLKLLEYSIGVSRKNPYFLFFIPIFFFINALLVYYLWPKDDIDTTDKVIKAVHENKSISWKSGLKAFFLPIITISGGGSAGKEAPAADVGAASASVFSKLLRLNREDRRKLMICGVSAGFASVFGTPIAGAIFGVEVLFVGGILYEVLLPSFIAGIVSYQVSNALGIHYFTRLEFFPEFSNTFFLKIIFAGIIFGLLSYFIIETFKFSKIISNRIKIWPPLKAFFAGALIASLAYLFSTIYLGLGLEYVESILEGMKLVWYAFLLKLLFTVITLNFGGSGGSITPIIFIGAAAGMTLGSLLGLDSATSAAIGLISVLAGATNTPIAASIMAIELFGTQLGAYAAISAVISFLVTGYRSLYPSQIFKISKSPSIDIVKGKKASNIKIVIKPKKSSEMKYIIGAINKKEKIVKKIKSKRKKLKEEIIKDI